MGIKKHVTIIIFCCFVVCANAQPQNCFALVCDSMGIGVAYADTSGAFVVEPGVYDRCFTPCFDSVAIVKKSDRIYAINKKLEIIFRVFKADTLSHKSGIFRIVENNKIGFANLAGEIIVEPRYDAALPFVDNKAFVNLGAEMFSADGITHWERGKWGAVNKQGRVVVPIKFSEINYQTNSGTIIRTSTYTF